MYTDQERINRLEHLAKEQEKENQRLKQRISDLEKSIDAISSRTFGQIMVGGTVGG